MRINANQITALRIILLPLPLFLIYGNTLCRIIALVIFTILGLTDYLDGVMARRYGVTPLGRLLDPIADKIFLAVTAVPLVDLGMLPIWIVWLIFFREFLITEMRRFMTPDKKGLRVTELAKLKTTIQMIGMGLILLNSTFPDKLITISFLSGLFLATIFLAVAMWAKGQEITQRVKSALLFESIGLLSASVLGVDSLNIFYGLVILGVTILSGGQYFWACLPSVSKKGFGAWMDIIYSLLIPLVVLGLLPWAPKNAHFLVILILAIEFAVQGIDMWAVQENRFDLSNLKKRIFIPTLLVIFILMFVARVNFSLIVGTFFVASALFSLSYLILDIWKHSELFRKGDFF